jgi:hypothetical protein
MHVADLAALLFAASLGGVRVRQQSRVITAKAVVFVNVNIESRILHLARLLCMRGRWRARPIDQRAAVERTTECGELGC